MFALEIQFADDHSASEVLLVRRSFAIIGASKDAHVEIPDIKDLPYQLQLVRETGRRFRVEPVGTASAMKAPSWAQGIYDGDAEIDLGLVKLSIASLDLDLQLKEMEAPDRAGVRVLRTACVSKSPTFPAVVIKSNPHFVVSFSADQTLLVGRHRHCQVRLDAKEVAERHARIGYESGQFWVEDLGSTSGTFVGGQQISGRVNIKAGMPIFLGKVIQLFGATSQEQVTGAIEASVVADRIEISEAQYPLLISQSPAARPAKIILKPGVSIVLGRDPGCDMWLGAPHVSRRHCVVQVNKAGYVSIVDESTNGTAHAKGILRKGDELQVGMKPTVLDFGADVTVGVCFSQADEQKFVASTGKVNTFEVVGAELLDAQGFRQIKPERKTTTLFMDRLQKQNMNQKEASPKNGFILLLQEMAVEQPLLLAISSICLGIVVLVVIGLLFPIWR